MVSANRRPWSAREVRYLLDNAGNVPQREICRNLRRSSESVKQMAKRLRAQGYDVDLRYYEPHTVTCPSCGRKSTTARETGMCRPCMLRRRLAATEGGISDLMQRLPPEARAIYEETEAEKGSRVYDPMPMPPTYQARPTRYQRRRNDEEYDRALEQWEARLLHRELKAAQKRKERIQRRLRKL